MAPRMGLSGVPSLRIAAMGAASGWMTPAMTIVRTTANAAFPGVVRAFARRPELPEVLENQGIKQVERKGFEPSTPALRTQGFCFGIILLTKHVSHPSFALSVAALSPLQPDRPA